MKLRKTLQMSRDADVLGQTADTLGIDSLIAVDVKSWFLKEVGIDMPVLTILGGATISEILEKAQQLLSCAMPAARNHSATGNSVALDYDISVEPVTYGPTSFDRSGSAKAKPVPTSPTEALHLEPNPESIRLSHIPDTPGLEVTHDGSMSVRCDKVMSQTKINGTRQELESTGNEMPFTPLYTNTIETALPAGQMVEVPSNKNITRHVSQSTQIWSRQHSSKSPIEPAESLTGSPDLHNPVSVERLPRRIILPRRLKKFFRRL
jgi:hybrid polyketide synthase/nonribosomal peptide synthetase ACE1